MQRLTIPSILHDYSRSEIKIEMQKLIANICLRKPAMNILPENFERFSYIIVDTEHQKDTFFTRSLLRACVDSSDSIIADLDVIDDDDFPLYNNMRDPVLQENRINRQRNGSLIAIIALAILSYAQSKHSNLVQKENTQFAFANNIPKQFAESFHQLGLMISYEFLRCSLQSNAKAVMDSIIEKTRSQQFFILYDNINFYENVRNQRVFNCRALLNYTTGYVCFMKTNNRIEDGADNWEEQYIDNS